MDVAARVSCKGQITIPKAIRDALSLDDGDQVLFRLEGDRAVIAKTPSLLELEGTLSQLVPRKVAPMRSTAAARDRSTSRPARPTCWSSSPTCVPSRWARAFR